MSNTRRSRPAASPSLDLQIPVPAPAGPLQDAEIWTVSQNQPPPIQTSMKSIRLCKNLLSNTGVFCTAEFHRKRIEDTATGTTYELTGGYAQAGYFFSNIFPSVPNRLNLLFVCVCRRTQCHGSDAREQPRRVNDRRELVFCRAQQ